MLKLVVHYYSFKVFSLYCEPLSTRPEAGIIALDSLRDYVALRWFSLWQVDTRNVVVPPLNWGCGFTGVRFASSLNGAFYTTLQMVSYKLSAASVRVPPPTAGHYPLGRRLPPPRGAIASRLIFIATCGSRPRERQEYKNPFAHGCTSCAGSGRELDRQPRTIWGWGYDLKRMTWGVRRFSKRLKKVKPGQHSKERG